jgi:uncharacterized protein (DUF1330 family)
MPVAYLVVEMKITDPEKFKGYMAAAPATVAAHGGEYLARGGRLDVLEGDWRPPRLVLLRFPSFEQAQAFYRATDYQAARLKREGATEYFNMVLTEGLEAPV